MAIIKVDGKMFKIARAEKGLTVSRLSEISGISRKTIGDIESGSKPEIRAHTLNQLSEALEKPIAFFQRVDIDRLTDETNIPDSFTDNHLKVIRQIVFGVLLQNSSRGETHYLNEKWLSIAGEEFGEICQSLQKDEPWAKDSDSSNTYMEIIDLAVVMVRWAEQILRTNQNVDSSLEIVDNTKFT